MGIINKLTKRCVFCKARADNYVPAYGMYNEVCDGNWYHKECLSEVSCYPERYRNNTVDMAISIIDRIRETKKRKEGFEQRAKDNCEYLKTQCV